MLYAQNADSGLIFTSAICDFSHYSLATLRKP